MEEGGLTEDELLDWMASHTFPLLKNERDRTRPAREAKRLARKEAADGNKCSDTVTRDLVEQTFYNEAKDQRYELDREL